MTLDTEILKAIVPPQLHRFRLDQVLVKLFPQYSRTQLQYHIQSERVYVDQKIIRQNRMVVLSGQCIEVCPIIYKQLQDYWQSEAVAFQIIYEDDALLIINKPAGLVTHPAPGHSTQTLANGLLHYLPTLAHLPRAGIIHRLDRDTTGLMVVPKTLSVYNYLVQELSMRQIERRYHALVYGTVITGGTIDFPIGRHPHFRQKQAVNSINGKAAVTHYHVLSRFARHTLLEVKLETGRTHQIRVHMAYIGHGIVGDPVYKTRVQNHSFKKRDKQYSISVALSEMLKQFVRQALHAHTLGLLHPTKKEFMRWHTPVPEDMQQLIDLLSTDQKFKMPTAHICSS